MIKTTIAALALAIAAPAIAQYAPPKTYYDWQSGNSYTVRPDRNGASIQGYNMNNGSMWSQRQNRDGTYNGTDAQGNFYSGNNRTGSYYNFGTGRTCYGTGALRTCY